MGDSPYKLPGGDDKIIAEVLQQTLRSSSDPDETEELDNLEEDNTEEGSKDLSYWQGMEMCEALEQACVDVESVNILIFQGELQWMRGYFHRMDFSTCHQATLEWFWA